MPPHEILIDCRIEAQQERTINRKFGIKHDDFEQNGKTPILPFRAQRKISEIIEIFLVTVLLDDRD